MNNAWVVDAAKGAFLGLCLALVLRTLLNKLLEKLAQIVLHLSCISNTLYRMDRRERQKREASK